jgi:hypothetical protein
VNLKDNLMRAKVIKKLGGFPNDCPIDVIFTFLEKISRRCQWIIDKSVVSQHLKN